VKNLLTEAPAGSYVLPAIVAAVWLVSWRLSRGFRVALLPVAFVLAGLAFAIGFGLSQSGEVSPECKNNAWCQFGAMPDSAWVMYYSAVLEFLLACALVFLSLVGEAVLGVTHARRQGDQGV
jgi:hypothetical protein